MCKRGNLERHFNSKHKEMNTQFPLNSELRERKVQELKNCLKGQQTMFTKTIDKNKAATLASLRVGLSKMIAIKKKTI